jgi:putative addiction module component (TIGR02574 family)
MDVVLKDVEVQALQLPPQQRSELIHSLIASLDGPMQDSPEAIAKAWDDEIGRRVADMDAGRTHWIAGDEALARIRARITDAKTVHAA